MDKKKPIRHMGMTMTDQEHRQWHRRHEGKDLPAKEHKKLMESLGIGEKEDRRWHKAQTDAREPAGSVPDGRPANPFAIGGGFLQYCVKQGWLVQLGSGRAIKYLVTEAGQEALAGYGITKY